MSYAQFSLIDASDFNTLVGGNPTTTSGTLNAVWATGGGAFGFGQTALANVSVGQSVAATGQWASLVANTASAATHQGSSITAVTAPVSGGTITYLSAIPTNLTTISTNKLNAATQGSTATNTATRGTTWSSALTFTHTATFANGDAARYFFNSGGQLKLTCSHANSTDNITYVYIRSKIMLYNAQPTTELIKTVVIHTAWARYIEANQSNGLSMTTWLPFPSIFLDLDHWSIHLLQPLCSTAFSC
jgi:hypothetical protein